MPRHWNSATILMISDDPDFSRALSARLQSERVCPGAILMGADLCGGLASANFDAAVVGPIPPDRLPAVLASLGSLGKPVVLVGGDNCDPPRLPNVERGLTVVRHADGFLDTLVVVLSQILKTEAALARARQAEREETARSSEAALGRYMLEMRHAVNNSLTSLLGNSDLLLNEPGVLSASTRSQVATMRSMALRIHEVFQRFSSLEKELAVMEPHCDETLTHPRTLAGRA